MKWFNYAEFDSPDAPGSGEAHMDSDFLQMLDRARGLAGVPRPAATRSGSLRTSIAPIRATGRTSSAR
jgi:hypothetical protein